MSANMFKVSFIVFFLVLALICLKQVSFMPISVVSVHSNSKFISTAWIEKMISEHVQHGFIKLRVGKLKQSLESSTLVAKADVKKVWPDRLDVNIKESKVEAVYKGIASDGIYKLIIDSRLVDPSEVKDGSLAHVPVIYAPVNLQELALRTFTSISTRIQEESLELKSLRLMDENCWQAEFKNGIIVKLGSSEIEERLSRFLVVYQHKLKDQEVLQGIMVDTRYTNGVAVG